MPIDAGTSSAGVGFGLDMAKFSFQQAANAQANKKNREWQEEMYNKQRRDSLADWNMQNEYNSPGAQMARLKAAGLNPNLVYGNGATATATSLPRQSDTGNYEHRASGMDISNPMLTFYDAQIKQAQISNMDAQKVLLDEQARHEAIKALNTLSNTRKTDADTQTVNELRQSYLDALRADIQKKQQDIYVQGNQEARNQELHPGALKQQQKTTEKIASDIAAQRIQNAKTQNEILHIKRQMLNMQRDGMLKDIEIDVRSRGGNPNDAYWEKKLQEVVEYILEGGKNWKAYLDMITRENPR